MVAVAPAISEKLTPPSLLDCHCNAGAGLPLADDVKLAELPMQIVWFAGFKPTTGAELIICVTTSDELPLKMLSPLYSAVIKCAPAAKPDVEKVACPNSSKAWVARSAPPSLKSTVPEGVPVSIGIPVTVAVNITDCPMQTGLAEELRSVELLINWADAGAAVSHATAQASSSALQRKFKPVIKYNGNLDLMLLIGLNVSFGEVWAATRK